MQQRKTRQRAIKQETPTDLAVKYIHSNQDPDHIEKRWIDEIIGNYLY